MTQFLPNGATGTLITGSPQTLIPSPGSGKRLCRMVRVHNNDANGTTVRVIISCVDGASTRTMFDIDISRRGTLTLDEALVRDVLISSPARSIVGKVWSGSYTLDWESSWGDDV